MYRVCAVRNKKGMERAILECSKTIVPRLVGILWIRLWNDILRSIIEYLWMCCLQWRAWREESDCTKKPNWDKPHVIRYLDWDCFPGHLFIHHPLLCIINNTNIRHQMKYCDWYLIWILFMMTRIQTNNTSGWNLIWAG